MANRYQSDERIRRDRYGRQEEQFQSDYNQGADRQMGDSWRDYSSQHSDFEADDRYGQMRGDRVRQGRNRSYSPYTGSDFQSRERNRDRGYDAADRAADAFATGAGSQLAAAHGEWHEPADRYRTGGYDRDYRPAYRGRDSERGFFERAGDEIASWFGDDDAQRRRERDHRGHGPAGYTRSDERIRDDVNDRLTDDYRVDARNVTVTVKDGEVTLDGTVTSRDQKRRAEDVVEDLSGVKHVQNNLRVADGATWDRNNSGDAAA